MDEFDAFLNPGESLPEDLASAEAPQGPSISSLATYTPRKFMSSVLSVYEQLGGEAWLLEQAKENPKEFLSILKQMLPKNVNIDQDSEIKITITAQQENLDMPTPGRILDMNKKVDINSPEFKVKLLNG